MRKEEITGKRAFVNMIWRFAERFGAQIVSFVVSVIIARIIDPEAYGTVAIISVFIAILFVFVDSGLASALIQKKESDDIDFSTVFYTNIFICAVLYIGLFLAAPYIAVFYNNLEMTTLIRVSGLTLILSSVKNVQQAYVSKHLIFKKFFWSTLGGTIGSAAVGITMAFAGYGVWALVISSLFNSTVDMIVLWITVKWRPKLVFSFDRLKGLFSYGSSILFASVVYTVYSNMYELIIGKVFKSIDLAYYNKGKSIPNMIVSNIDDSINSVLLPVMSEKQDDVCAVKCITKRALKMNIYIMSPLFAGMAAISEPLVRVLLTDKWMPSVIYMKIFCICLIFRPITTANLSAIKALGKSNMFFKLEIVKDVLGIIFLLITVRYSVMAIAIGVMINCFLCHIINAWPSKKIINYSFQEQLLDILPNLLLVAVMGIVVYLIKFIEMNDIVTLAIQVLAGIIIYIGCSHVFKMESYLYILDMIKHLKREM